MLCLVKRPLPVSEYLCPEIKKEASEDENIPERDLKPVPGRSRTTTITRPSH